MVERLDKRVGLGLAALGLVNVLLALFFLPYTPGLDEPQLLSVVYAHQHHGRLFYPAYDLEFMYLAPPTKYWLVSLLVSLGASVRLATAGLFLTAYLAAILGVFACRLTTFQRLAALVAIPAAATLHPFIAFDPENLTYAETIGRLRPDDLVLMLWLAGLLWLEASRRSEWRLAYGFVGALCLGLASVTHWHGLPALGAAGVYAAAALFDGGRRVRRVGIIALGVALAVVPCAVILAPYRDHIYRVIANQGGDLSSRALADVWRRHCADFAFLQHWMTRHFGNVWAPASLLAVPAWLGVPPVVLAGVMLLARRSTRVLGLAGLVLPLAVLRASRKSAGYELPEIALFLLACGWALAPLLDRRTGRSRLVAAGLVATALATSSPLAWHASRLRFMDESHSLQLLRAMGRAVIGPGASAVGPFYAPGEDIHVLNATPVDPGIDFVAEREFHLASGPLHRLYKTGKTRLAGFVLTPEMPSASIVYWSARDRAPLSGFLARAGRVERFSSPGTGWSFTVLKCRATSDELSWVSPRTPVPIAGYVPRTDHCVNRVLEANGLAGRFASVFLRRTWSFSSMAEPALVPLLIDDSAEAASAQALERECGCQGLESTRGSLEEVPAHWLLAALERTQPTIRFYADARDLAAGRDMATRFGLEARR